MNRSHRDQLDDLQRRLAKLEPYPWSAVEGWIAAATPFIREALPKHLEDFQKVCEPPRWTALPRFASGGGVWDEHPRQDNFAEAAAAEDTANRRKASEARERISAFLETVARLNEDVQDAAARDASHVVHSFLDRFGYADRALRIRQRQREPLRISDE